jgi:hypothetical protein
MENRSVFLGLVIGLLLGGVGGVLFSHGYVDNEISYINEEWEKELQQPCRFNEDN